MDLKTIEIHFEDTVCFVRFSRPEAKNTITPLLIEECRQVISQCEEQATVVIFEGSPEYFCFGADFQGIHDQHADREKRTDNPEPLYDLWAKNGDRPVYHYFPCPGAGKCRRVGFVAASDIVIADESASFSLSELLFGLFPACVLPFLIRKIGFQKAHYLTLMTKPVSVQQAFAWDLSMCFRRIARVCSGSISSALKGFRKQE